MTTIEGGPIQKSEPLSPAERGKASYDLQMKFFDAIRVHKPSQDARHKAFVEDPQSQTSRFTFITEINSQEVLVHVWNEVRFGPSWDYPSELVTSVTRSLHLDTFKLGTSGEIKTRDLGKRTEIKVDFKKGSVSGDIVDYDYGDLRMTNGNQPVDVDSEDKQSYENVWKELAPLFDISSEEQQTEVPFGPEFEDGGPVVIMGDKIYRG